MNIKLKSTLILKQTAIIWLTIVFLITFVSFANAATVTWDGGGINNLASNSYNWSGDIAPQNGDNVIFDGTSIKDCTWDFNVTTLSITKYSSYTGNITKESGITLAIEKGITWTGLGSDDLASTPANWSGNAIPQDGDKVILNDTSSDNMTWDLTGVEPALFSVSPGYSGTVTLNTALTVTGNLYIAGGTLNLNNYALNVDGYLMINTDGTILATSSTITVKGHWVNAGAFNPGSSTVIFAGTNQYIYGETTFYNLIKTVTVADTLYFEAGSTQTVFNSLTLTGTENNLLSLRSTADGEQFNLVLDSEAPPPTLDYLDVKDSDTTGGVTLYAGSNSINSGNNLNWSIGGCTDSDGDGICEDIDNCPSVANADQLDTDSDGIGDVCDTCPLDYPDDTDGDGVCDSDDICEGSDDNVDTDGDGVPDGCDICAGGDDAVDGDEDGVPDFCDNCPLVDNTDQLDTDSDGVGDVCDYVGVAISTCTELQNIQNDPSGDYVLTQDIDCSATDPDDPDYDEDGPWDDGKGFDPIGTFTGTFDGQGYEIHNLYISKTGESFVGFFGSISGATIQNTGFTNIMIVGSWYVGSLVGNSTDSIISNSYSTGSVGGYGKFNGGLVGRSIGSTISNSHFTGSVFNPIGDYVGGLVGYSNGSTITKSYATGSVTGSNKVGGLVGYSDSSFIADSYSISNLPGGFSNGAGGLVGSNKDSTITRSYASGSLDGDEYVGGLVGGNSGTSVITDSYATGSVNGDQYVGGLVGYNSATITNSYSIVSVTCSGEGIAGLVGYGNGAVSNSYWNKDASGQNDGCYGDTTCGEGAEGKTTAEMLQKDTYQPEWDFVGDPDPDNIWTIKIGISYPCHQWDVCSLDSDYDGIEDDGDSSGIVGDNLCTGGDTDSCDDNCLNVPNADQADADSDGAGDVCDVCAGFDDIADGDGDGVPDGCDICAGFDDTVDGDGDGVPDGCDICAGGDDTVDGDGDGVPDGCDICAGGDDTVDGDGDGVPDFCDVCPLDNPDDTDRDGVCDSDDICAGGDDTVDVDGDGVPDGCDNCPLVANADQADFDDDGIGDACDDNSEAISSCEELQLIGNDVNYPIDGNYALTQDIDCSASDPSDPGNYGSVWYNGGLGFDPLGDSSAQYAGTFNGQGYEIQNLFIDRPDDDYLGLFGKTDGAEINNIGVTDANIAGLGYAGGLVGWNSNSIISNSYATGSVSSGSSAGGLVGENHNSSSIINSYSFSSVNGGSSAGGLVGENYESSIINSYSIGSVSGNGSVGGLVGQYSNVTISNSYWNTDTSGQSEGCGEGDCSGATGQETADMVLQSTFTGWDFSGIWAIDEGVFYPCHKWYYGKHGSCQVVPATWTGNSQSDPTNWDEPGNWDFDIVPSSVNEVIIPDVMNAPVLVNHAEVYTLTIESGANLNLSGFDLNISGDLIINGTLDATTDNSIITAGGNWTNNGTFNIGNSSVEFNGDSTHSILSGGQSFYDVVFNNPAGSWVFEDSLQAHDLTITAGTVDTFTDNNALTVYDDLVVGAGGILNINTPNVLIGGDWDTSAGTFNAGTSTVTLAGNSNSIISSGSSPFYYLQIDKPSMILTLLDDLSVLDDLNIYLGTLNTGASHALDIEGDMGIGGTLIANSSQINVAGAWNNQGVFSCGESTVILDGLNQTVWGDNTFYNLIKNSSVADTLFFEEDKLQTVSNNLTLQGTEGNILSLSCTDCTNSETYWYINPVNEYYFSYLNIDDAYSYSDAIILLDSTNNVGTNVEGIASESDVCAWLFYRFEPDLVMNSQQGGAHV